MVKLWLAGAAAILVALLSFSFATTENMKILGMVPAITAQPSQFIYAGLFDYIRSLSGSKSYYQLTDSEIDGLIKAKNDLDAQAEVLRQYEAQYALTGTEQDMVNAERQKSMVDGMNQSYAALLRKYSMPQDIDNMLTEIKKNAGWEAGYNPVLLMKPEDRKILLGIKSSTGPMKSQPVAATTPKLLSSGAPSLPASFDWRSVGKKDYTTSIKNQGNCGSCWAFGIAAGMESQAKIYYNNPSLSIDLSEQDFLSCAGPGSCKWLTVSNDPAKDELRMVLDYAKANGISTEKCFPYKASDDILCPKKCTQWTKDDWKIGSYEYLPTGDINAIKNTLVNKGPVLAVMDVYNRNTTSLSERTKIPDRAVTGG